MSKTRFYFAGGCGINQGLIFGNGTHARNQDVEICFVDTSDSNDREKQIDPELYYQIQVPVKKGMKDGSGQDRAANYPIIRKEVPGIIELFEPGDFNVVVYSGGGGSGSVIGPVIHSNLLKLGLPTVSIVVGSELNKNVVENTIGTLKSLEGIAIVTSLPVVMDYHENTVGVQEALVDEGVQANLEALVALTSQRNAGLDTADVANWVQLKKVNEHPQLAILNICAGKEEAQTVLEPLAVASLYVPEIPEIQFLGGPFTVIGRTTEVENQQHYVISTSRVEDVFKVLNERLAELVRQQAAFRKRRTIVTTEDAVDDSGMVV